MNIYTIADRAIIVYDSRVKVIGKHSNSILENHFVTTGDRMEPNIVLELPIERLPQELRRMVGGMVISQGKTMPEGPWDLGVLHEEPKTPSQWASIIDESYKRLYGELDAIIRRDFEDKDRPFSYQTFDLVMRRTNGFPDLQTRLQNAHHARLALQAAEDSSKRKGVMDKWMKRFKLTK